VKLSFAVGQLLVRKSLRYFSISSNLIVSGIQALNSCQSNPSSCSSNRRNWQVLCLGSFLGHRLQRADLRGRRTEIGNRLGSAGRSCSRLGRVGSGFGWGIL